MMLIGVCGSSGSGKSVVSAIFAQNGITVLDCDRIYAELVANDSPCLREIRRVFGESIAPHGKLDRKKLSEIIFSDEEKRLELNRITHYFVAEELRRRIERSRHNGEKACLIDAPLLFEAGIDKWCDRVIGVIAPVGDQIERLIKRDGIAKEQAQKRIATQKSHDFLKENCTDIIENNGALSDLEEKAKRLMEEWHLL